MGDCRMGIMDAQFHHKVSFEFFFFPKLYNIKALDIMYAISLKGANFVRLFPLGVALAQLPHELITGILIGLPVKSLLRFKCVSKSFREIIDSPYFDKSHLNKFAEDRSHLNLIFPERNQILTNYNSVKFHNSDLDISELYGLEVYGYCNGVFLLLINKSRPALWNPSTHQYRILPSLPGHPGRLRGIRLSMGLGYDSSQDNYRVVVIQSYLLKAFIAESRVLIFGSRSNSARSRICTNFPSGTWAAFLSYFGSFADGYLHWLYKNASYGQKVVAFDMAKETFSFLTLPAYFPKVWGSMTDLNVLDGCLCMAFRTYGIKCEALLYVRKKKGAEFTWSLLYSVTYEQLPPFLDLVKLDDVEVLGYSKEGDKILLDFGLECIVSYDLKEKSFQPTEIIRPTNYH